MNLQLEGKRAFISGSTGGIGFATAKSLLSEGASVIINGRSTASVEHAISLLKQEFPEGNIKGMVTDFSDVNAVHGCIERLPAVDILINNVGVYESKSFFETSDTDWYHQFEVNVMSGVRLSRYCLPHMLNKDWGRILFVSSECAVLVPEDMIAYSMTKTAILGISRGLAQLTKGSSVTVNTILPGSTLSEGAANFLKNSAAKQGKKESEIANAFFTETRSSSLLQRFASVEEVAHTLTYLSSPLASATNGAAIKVDGGSIGGIL